MLPLAPSAAVAIAIIAVAVAVAIAAVAVIEGGHNGESGPHTGADVGHGDAHLLGVAAQIAGDAHNAADALHNLVVGGAVAVGAVGAKAGYGAIDDGGVELLDGGVVQVETPHHIGGKVFHDDIGVGGQLPENPLRRFVPQVEGQAALVAVDRQEIGGFGADERRPPLAGVVAAAGHFDFDDVGAVVAEHQGAERPGQGAGQIQHFHAFQRLHHR